jgi:signal peptidase I
MMLPATPTAKDSALHPASPSGMVNTMAIMAIVALFVLTFVVQSFQIPSGSMENTFLVGDFLLVDKLVYSPSGFLKGLLPYREPRDGDVIIFHHPFDPGLLLVKRVIGVPGDHIRMRDGVVYRNGAPLAEPYAMHVASVADHYRDNFPDGAATDERVRTAWSSQLMREACDGEFIVPAGGFFVMGDNRDLSLDSRYWGIVPRQNIVGRPLFIYFSRDVWPKRDDKLGHERDTLSARFARIFRVVH